MRNKKATKNPKNDDDKFFQHAVTAALNHQNIKNHPERIKLFINNYNWKVIHHTKKDWKKFESNNKSIAFNNQ